MEKDPGAVAFGKKRALNLRKKLGSKKALTEHMRKVRRSARASIHSAQMEGVFPWQGERNMTTDANELSLNELNPVWAANHTRIIWPDSDLQSVPRQFRERTQDSIRTDGRHTYTQDVGRRVNGYT
jgi:hypothetical protein